MSNTDESDMGHLAPLEPKELKELGLKVIATLPPSKRLAHIRRKLESADDRHEIQEGCCQVAAVLMEHKRNRRG